MRILSLLLLAALALPAAPPEKPAAQPSADQALARLLEGNRRYVAHKEIHPDNSIARRRDLAVKGQHPFAVILGCADSRVPPELVFDQGLGGLFVIRDAGNVIDDEILGSIEYAVEHLHTPLVMVLGHEKCGAVTAAVEGAEAHGHMRVFLDSIRPAVEESRHQPGDAVHNCVVANALRVARQIRESEPLLRPAVQAGRVKVLAANYDLATGKVVVLTEKSAAAPQNRQPTLSTGAAPSISPGARK